MVKFEHQQFEEWLLSDETLTREQSQVLHEHLQTCKSCQTLSDGLHGIERQLKSAAVISPAPGFTERWQMRLAEERLHRGRRQALVFLALSLAGAAVFFATLAYLVWPVIQSPYPLLLVMAVRITSVYATADSAASVLSTLFVTIVRVVPPTLWIGLAVAIFSLFIVWLFILRKLVIQRRSAS